LDNYFAGRKNDILELLDNPFFELVRHDITEPYYSEVDEIYNLACPASPVDYQHNLIKIIKASVMGAVHVLRLAKKLGVKSVTSQ
jgi:UDP-glucuronate decarboxylase